MLQYKIFTFYFYFMNRFLFVTATFWNVRQNLLFNSHIGLVHEHLFQLVTVTLHFDGRNNTTDRQCLVQYQGLGIVIRLKYKRDSRQMFKDLIRR
jgi:hypothetical protein